MKICHVAACDKPSLARGMCNGHYLQFRRGTLTNKPIRIQQKNRICSVDGCAKKHYGDGFCKAHFGKNQRKKLKSLLINELGGKCAHCQQIFHSSVYDFHHCDPSQKDFMLTDKLNCFSYAKLLEEAKKCILLCANCHRLEHARLHEE